MQFGGSKEKGPGRISGRSDANGDEWYSHLGLDLADIIEEAYERAGVELVLATTTRQPAALSI